MIKTINNYNKAIWFITQSSHSQNYYQFCPSYEIS